MPPIGSFGRSTTAFLETGPSDSEILDALRSARKLPEQADYRSWKASALAAYRAIEAHETWWHLPDGRMLRVVTNPNPQGGLTYLFDDVTERVHLESRFNALTRVQGETLDTLKEGGRGVRHRRPSQAGQSRFRGKLEPDSRGHRRAASYRRGDRAVQPPPAR